MKSYLLAIVITLTTFLFLPTETNAFGHKKVEINLSTQTLQAYEGGNLIYHLTISSGKPWWPTPTGTFYPWTKLKSTRMRGGSQALGTYYNLPNVPYVVYFFKGYGLHGTYWHNNFGYPMSHGCVNLKTSDAEKLYYWIDMQTPITIYGVTPGV